MYLFIYFGLCFIVDLPIQHNFQWCDEEYQKLTEITLTYLLHHMPTSIYMKFPYLATNTK